MSSDAWVCPKCSYENQDYQRCMGPDCDTVRPGGQFDTSEFSLSTQPPSSGRRSTITSVAMNHPAAAARRSKKPPPPRRESPGRAAKTNAAANITEMSSIYRHPGGRFPTRPPREFTPTLLVPRKSATDDDSSAVATEEDSSRHGGGGRIGYFERFCHCCHRCGGEVVNSSVDSSNEEVVSVHSAPLFGVGVCDDSPNFSDHNDLMPDSPTDNKVSKYLFYSRLSHYMEGHKISESNRAAVELCLLSEAGAYVRNMDPMKKDKKESAFFAKYLSIVDEIEDDQFEDEESDRENMRRRYKSAKKDNSAQSLWWKYEAELPCLRNFAKKNRNWQLGGAAEWINTTPPHEEAIRGVALEREVSGKISLSSDL